MNKKKWQIIFFCISVFAMTNQLWAQSDVSNLVWDGYNPFHQPFSTTYYYGSGDVDLDGDVDRVDYLRVQDIYTGQCDSVIMADVDGNGTVDNADYNLIYQAVHYNQILPGWWNQLTSRAQREDWLRKMLAIDRVSENKYIFDYSCGSFSYETYLHFTGYRWGTSYYTKTSGEQTVFNIPFYEVTLPGHAVNAVFLGDNPLEYDDWVVIEPQSDYFYSVNTLIANGYDNVKIKSRKQDGIGTSYSNDIVTFNWQGSEFECIGSSNKLVLNRPQVQETKIINPSDRFYPQIINDKYVLFTQMREDMSRTSDIHFSPIQFDQHAKATAVTHDEEFSKLLDSCTDSQGYVHMVWRGAYNTRNSSGHQTDRHLGCYYGKYDIHNQYMIEKKWLGDYSSADMDARVIAGVDDEIHVFICDFREKNIELISKTDEGWSDKSEIVSDIGSRTLSPDYHFKTRHDSLYRFDADIKDNGNLQLAWIYKNSSHSIYYKEYYALQGSWGPDEMLYSNSGSYKPVGMTMAHDGSNTYISYWDYQIPNYQGNRGKLYLITNNGSAWSYPLCIDNNNTNACPRMVSNGRGRTALVWDKMTGSDCAVAYKLNLNAYDWSTTEILDHKENHQVYYPDVTITNGGNIYTCWSSRSEEQMEIETAEILSTPVSPVLYYSFDKYYPVDESGYNHHGNMTGSSGTQYIPGKRNTALSFSGGQIIQVSNKGALNIGTHDFAISCWLKVAPTTTGLGEILYKNGQYKGTSAGYTLQVYNGTPRLRIEDSKNEYAVTYYDNTIKINDNQWHLLTINVNRKSSQGIQFYIDGQLRYSGNALSKTESLYNESDLFIGGRTANSSYCFQGAIDELRIYNRQLLSEEIENLYVDFMNCFSVSFDNDSAMDVSGNGNAMDQGVADFASGVKGSSYEFNGENEMIVPDHSSLRFGFDAFSVSFWMKQQTGFEVQYLLDKRDTSLTERPGFGVWITDRGNTPGINFSIGNRSINKSFSSLLNNQWHHIVYTVESGTSGYISLYIDGVRKFRLSSNGAYISNSLPLLIGQNHANKSYGYTGALDELNFYNKALSSAEVTDLYTNP